MNARRSTRKPIRFALASVGALAVALVPGSVLSSGTASAATSCYAFWRHSGHTDNVRWYHCHDNRTVPGIGDRARVHICGFSGTLHGITVFHDIRDNWSTDNHAHDVGGEGC
jgi:hypothetical protein